MCRANYSCVTKKICEKIVLKLLISYPADIEHILISDELNLEKLKLLGDMQIKSIIN